MSRQMGCDIFFLFILLVFISTNVHGNTCTSSQTHCSNYPYDWCCASSSTCGTAYGQCYSTASYIFQCIIGLIFFVGFWVCVACWCRHLRRRRVTPMYNTNPYITSHPYQQQPTQRASPIVHFHPSQNVAAPPSNYGTYEQPPPSYEDATRNPSSKYSYPPAPPPS